MKRPADETPAQRKTRNDHETRQAALEAVENDPDVKLFMDTFDATIDKDSIKYTWGQSKITTVPATGKAGQDLKSVPAYVEKEERRMSSGLGDIMKQAQKMQESMQRAQEEIAATEVQGEAGAGMVKVIMTGRHDVKRVEIEPSLLNSDKVMLEDLIAAAVNDANRRVEKATRDRMADVTSGMGLPAGFKLPF